MPLSVIKTAVLAGLLAQTSYALPQGRKGRGKGFEDHHHGAWKGGKAAAKNYIFVVPDGHGHVHQSLARDYISLVRDGSGTVEQPVTEPLFVDEHVSLNVVIYPTRMGLMLTG